jgi:cell division protein FtsZ
VEQENLDYNALEVPTNIRRSPKTANDFVKAAESKNMEYLDIPAFLRRQAD